MKLQGRWKCEKWRSDINPLPEVTFVLSVYNNHRFLEEALNSIDQMTYQNMHLLIFNDCSPDGSKKVLDNFVFSKSFLSLKVIHSKTNHNRVLFNEVIKHVTTEYVAYGCDDDLQISNRLELQISKMIAEKALLCTGDAIVIDEVGNELGRAFNPFLNYDQIEHLISHFFSNYSFGAATCFSTKLFSHFGNLKGDLREIDFILPFRSFLLNSQPVRVAAPVIRWRRHTQNMSADNHLDSKKNQLIIEQNKLNNLREMHRILLLAGQDFASFSYVRELLEKRIIEHEKKPQ